MASGTSFRRSCPTCGRALEIRVDLLGKEVECVHCGGSFTASEASHRQDDDLKIEQLLRRAQQYVDSVAPSNQASAEHL